MQEKKITNKDMVGVDNIITMEMFMRENGVMIKNM